jgi:uncharacterized protein (TIGR00255 family)
MKLHSMTGFAREDGQHGAYRFGWELKSVNSKGLDVKFRLPSGWEALEAGLRQKLGERLSRGALFAQLQVVRQGSGVAVRINEDVLQALAEAGRGMAARHGLAPPTLDGLMALRGVVDIVEEEETEADRKAAEHAVLDGFLLALEGLVSMRAAEGQALQRVLEGRLQLIADLTHRAETAPGRRPEAIRARLQAQIEALMGSAERFDHDRLHQEALMLATKADIREELDRLDAHVAAARKLLAEGGPVGRKLDFLAQEFNRETNTLCAKSNDVDLTTIGLELKATVEQFREQVQNLE